MENIKNMQMDDSHFLVEQLVFGSDPFLVTSASNKLDENMRQAKLSASKTEFFEHYQQLQEVQALVQKEQL